MSVINNTYQQTSADHIKVNIEQTAKGARVTITLDRSDHDIDKAVEQAIETYERTLLGLKTHGFKVDEVYDTKE